MNANIVVYLIVVIVTVTVIYTNWTSWVKSTEQGMFKASAEKKHTKFIGIVARVIVSGFCLVGIIVIASIVL